MNRDLPSRIAEALRVIPDFPEPGIRFRDITPLLGAPFMFGEVVTAMAAPHAGDVTHVVGIESRGFMFGAPVALSLNAGFVPARKPGRLPHETVRETYTLEYRTDALELHVDAFPSGARVLVVDDVLATGGTAAAACALVERLGGVVMAVVVLAEIVALGGRVRLASHQVRSLVQL